MIKILTLPTENLTFEHHCSCGTIFTYRQEDTKGDYIICPVCANAEPVSGDKIIPEFEVPEELQESHFHYPEDFYHFGNGKKLSNDETQELINNVFSHLSRGESHEFRCCSTGDTLVSGYRDDSDITIWVAKDYYEDSCDADVMSRE